MQDAVQNLTVIECHVIHTRLTVRHVLNRRCLSLVHGNTKCVMLVDVTWMLIFYTTGVASSWHRNRKVYSACECASHLWYQNRSCGKRAVENSRDVVQKLRTSQLGVLEVRRESRLFSYQFSRIAHLFRDDCPMGKHCGNGNDIDTLLSNELFVHISVDRRSILQVWGCAAHPQQSPPSTGYCTYYARTWASDPLHCQCWVSYRQGRCLGSLCATWQTPAG